jgi:hypothetical protein
MKEALVQFPWPNLVLIPLILFFVIFVGALIWTDFKSRRQLYSKISQLPLEGEDYE